MTIEKLQDCLNEGESEHLEFKTSFGQDTIETLVAFANAKGGMVLLGVSDEKEIKGVPLAKESINQWINEIKSKTAPQLIPNVEILEKSEKTIVCMSITEYPVKPVACKGRYYKRIVNTNHLLSIQDVVNLHLQSVNSSWDFYIRPNKDITRISLDKVNRQIEIINNRKQSVTDDPLTFLRKYSLIDGEKITNACWLLFLPEQESTTTIELGHFASPTIIKDSLTLKNDLFTEVDEVMNFVRKHINKEIIITGEPRNTERWQYPLEAIRELVLNMIVHRDYTSSYDSVIKIFNEYIEFYNPGALPDSISVKQLLSDDYVSQPRNRQIAEMFKETGMIEKYGSGIKRVCKAFVDYGLQIPEFVKLPDGLIVRVFAKKILETDLKTETDLKKGLETDLKTESDLKKGLETNIKTNITENVTENREDVTENVTENIDVTENRENVTKNVTENIDDVTENKEDVIENVTENRENLILQFIRIDNKISTVQLAKKLNITRRTIHRDLEKLKEKRLIERVGPDKGGYWKIL